MKTFFKRFLQILLLAFLAMQFFRPTKNTATALSSADITTKYTIPEDVHSILKRSCYDCHSNNTVYPWYSNIQPVAWFLADHVKEGKKELNFSEFASYRIGRQYRKLEEISHQLEEDEMPLSSYTIIHRDAKLSMPDKKIMYNWINTLRDSIKVQYPLDSLVRKSKG